MKIWLPVIATGTGAEIYARRLADGLAARGHTAILDVVPHIYQYVPWAAPLSAPQGTHVTIANSWSAAAFHSSVPLVTVVHHVVHDPALAPHKTFAQLLFHRWFVQPMELLAMRRSALVIAVSETTKRAIGAHFSNVPVCTILNGIDVDFFNPGHRRIKEERNRPMELLFVGKPSRRKAFDTVARIIAALGDECRLTCIGPESERGLSLPPGEYLGRVSREQLREAYRSTDLLLMPSRLEGFGYAAAEAMACGVPVAACLGTAVADLIPVNCGVVREADNIDGFVRDIRRLHADPVRRAALRKRLRAHALENLSEQRWIEQMEAALLPLVGAEATNS
jgi:glycosyltransferase involved in cell wall biosynthesis